MISVACGEWSRVPRRGGWFFRTDRVRKPGGTPYSTKKETRYVGVESRSRYSCKGEQKNKSDGTGRYLIPNKQVTLRPRAEFECFGRRQRDW